jgi:hypothetical protein
LNYYICKNLILFLNLPPFGRSNYERQLLNLAHGWIHGNSITIYVKFNKNKNPKNDYLLAFNNKLKI